MPRARPRSLSSEASADRNRLVINDIEIDRAGFGIAMDQHFYALAVLESRLTFDLSMRSGTFTLA